MKYIDCSTLSLPFLCRKLDYPPTTLAQCISCLDEGRIIAGVVYDQYNGASITAHIWIEYGRVPSRAWFVAIFDYAFNRLCVNKILGQVAGNNPPAQSLDLHLGFVEEGRIKGYSPDGDLILYTMTKEQCRVLTSPAWEKVANLVREVA